MHRGRGPNISSPPFQTRGCYADAGDYNYELPLLDRSKGAAKLQEKLRPLEADTLQAATLGQRPATAREAFQQQHEGLMGSTTGLTGRWRKVKVGPLVAAEPHLLTEENPTAMARQRCVMLVLGVQDRSDDMTPACDAVELPWILRKVIASAPYEPLHFPMQSTLQPCFDCLSQANPEDLHGMTNTAYWHRKKA